MNEQHERRRTRRPVPDDQFGGRLRDSFFLDLEVVVHGVGPLSRWVETVGVGTHIEGIGPRGVSSLRPGGTQHLFVVDNSGLPATYAIIETLPNDAPVHVMMVERP